MARLFKQLIITEGHRGATDRVQRIIFIVDAKQSRCVLLIEIMRDRGAERSREEVVLVGYFAAEARPREARQWQCPIHSQSEPLIMIVRIHRQIPGGGGVGMLAEVEAFAGRRCERLW